MNKKRFISIAVIVVVLVVAVLLLINANKKPSSFAVNVAAPKAAGLSSYYVALDKGFFLEQNLDVKDITVQTGDEAMKALLSNSADVAIVGTGPFSFVILENQDDVSIFSQLSYMHDTQMIARKDSGITKQEDLKGKKIGYVKTTLSDLGLRQFLKNYGIDEKDVSLVNIKPMALPVALESGQVDAYSAWEPHLANGKKLLGDNAIVFDDEKSTYTGLVMVAGRGDYVNNNKAELKKFITALSKAENFMKSNQDESIAIVAKKIAMPADLLKNIWNKYEFSTGLKDAERLLAADMGWANTQREKPVETIPAASKFINYSVINE